MGAQNSIYGEGGSSGGGTTAALQSTESAPGRGAQSQHTLRDRVLKMSAKDRQECELYKILKRPEDRARAAGGDAVPSTGEGRGSPESGGGAAAVPSTTVDNNPDVRTTDNADTNSTYSGSQGNERKVFGPSEQTAAMEAVSVMAPKKKFLERNRSASFSTVVHGGGNGDVLSSTSALASHHMQISDSPSSSTVDVNAASSAAGCSSSSRHHSTVANGGDESFRSRSASLNLRTGGNNDIVMRNVHMALSGAAGNKGSGQVVDMRSCIDAILESELLKKASPAPVSGQQMASSASSSSLLGMKRPSSKDSMQGPATRPGSRDPRMGYPEDAASAGRAILPPHPADLQHMMKSALMDVAAGLPGGEGASDEPARKVARRNTLERGRFTADVGGPVPSQMTRADLDRMAYMTGAAAAGRAAWPTAADKELPPAVAAQQQQQQQQQQQAQQAAGGRRATMPSNFGSLTGAQGGYHMRGLMPAVQGSGSIVTGQAAARGPSGQVGMHQGGGEHHQLPPQLQHAMAPAGLEAMARLQQQQAQAGGHSRQQSHHVMPLQFVGGGHPFPMQPAPGEHAVPRSVTDRMMLPPSGAPQLASHHRSPFSAAMEQGAAGDMQHRKADGRGEMMAWPTPTGYYGADGHPAYDVSAVSTDRQQQMLRARGGEPPALLPPPGGYDTLHTKSPNTGRHPGSQQQVSPAPGHGEDAPLDLSKRKRANSVGTVQTNSASLAYRLRLADVAEMEHMQQLDSKQQQQLMLMELEQQRQAASRSPRAVRGGTPMHQQLAVPPTAQLPYPPQYMQQMAAQQQQQQKAAYSPMNMPPGPVSPSMAAAARHQRSPQPPVLMPATNFMVPATSNGSVAQPLGPSSYDQMKYRMTPSSSSSSVESAGVPQHHVAMMVDSVHHTPMPVDRSMPVLRPVGGGASEGIHSSTGAIMSSGARLVPSTSPGSASQSSSSKDQVMLAAYTRSSNLELLGEHSPNDVLFIKCLPCGKTYGNIHKFKKHFLKEHQNEPTRSDIVVQTISATKDALARESMPPSDLLTSTSLSAGGLTHTGSDTVLSVEGKIRASEAGTQMVSTGGTAGSLGSLQCLQCGEEFPTRDWGMYRRHSKLHEQQNAGTPVTGDEQQRRYSSDRRSSGSLADTSVSGDGRPPQFACELCRAVFADIHFLVHHVESMHGGHTGSGSSSSVEVEKCDKSVSAPVFSAPLIMKATPDSTSKEDMGRGGTLSQADDAAATTPTGGSGSNGSKQQVGRMYSMYDLIQQQVELEHRRLNKKPSSDSPPENPTSSEEVISEKKTPTTAAADDGGSIAPSDAGADDYKNKWHLKKRWRMDVEKDDADKESSSSSSNSNGGSTATTRNNGIVEAYVGKSSHFVNARTMLDTFVNNAITGGTTQGASSTSPSAVSERNVLDILDTSRTASPTESQHSAEKLSSDVRRTPPSRTSLTSSSDATVKNSPSRREESSAGPAADGSAEAANLSPSSIDSDKQRLRSFAAVEKKMNVRELFDTLVAVELQHTLTSTATSLSPPPLPR